jgi:hypothetical protein
LNGKKDFLLSFVSPKITSLFFGLRIVLSLNVVVVVGVVVKRYLSGNEE